MTHTIPTALPCPVVLLRMDSRLCGWENPWRKPVLYENHFLSRKISKPRHYFQLTGCLDCTKLIKIVIALCNLACTYSGTVACTKTISGQLTSSPELWSINLRLTNLVFWNSVLQKVTKYSVYCDLWGHPKIVSLSFPTEFTVQLHQELTDLVNTPRHTPGRSRMSDQVIGREMHSQKNKTAGGPAVFSIQGRKICM